MPPARAAPASGEDVLRAKPSVRKKGSAGSPRRPKARGPVGDDVTAALEAMLQEVRELSSLPATGRNERHEALWEAIATAYRVWRKARRDEAWRAALDAAYARHKVKEPRRDSNPFTRVVKLCFPGRKASDYSRYAGVLRHAEHEGWSPTRLEAELARTPNALASLSRPSSWRTRSPSRRPSLYELGRGLVEEAKPLGRFEVEEAEPRLVLLIGQVGKHGEGVVRRVVTGQEAVLRRLLVAIARGRGK